MLGIVKPIGVKNVIERVYANKKVYMRGNDFFINGEFFGELEGDLVLLNSDFVGYGEFSKIKKELENLNMVGFPDTC